MTCGPTFWAARTSESEICTWRSPTLQETQGLPWVPVTCICGVIEGPRGSAHTLHYHRCIVEWNWHTVIALVGYQYIFCLAYTPGWWSQHNSQYSCHQSKWVSHQHTCRVIYLKSPGIKRQSPGRLTHSMPSSTFVPSTHVSSGTMDLPWKTTKSPPTSLFCKSWASAQNIL